MNAYPLGKVSVPTPGTPVALSLTGIQLPPGGLVAKIEAWPDPADAGVSFIKANGSKIAALKATSPRPWSTPDTDGDDRINPAQFTIDADTASNGPFVTIWVD